jgi:hypothetical protein
MRRTVHQLKKLAEARLVRFCHAGRKRSKEVRCCIAAARQFLVDPGLCLTIDRTARVLAAQLESVFRNWLRLQVLSIDLLTISLVLASRSDFRRGDLARGPQLLCGQPARVRGRFTLCHERRLLPRLDMTVLGGQTHPSHGLVAVPRHAPPTGTEQAEVVLGQGQTLLGGFPQPPGRFDIVALHALARQAHQAELRLGLRDSLLGGQAHPAPSDTWICSNALPAQVHPTRKELRLGQALLSRALDPAQRCSRVGLHALAAAQHAAQS